MKKFLCLLLSLVMIMGTVTVCAQNEEITVNLTVSIYGEFAKTQDGDDMVLVPITLDDKETYTIDDLLFKAHDEYCPDGYESATGEIGAYITRLWGDESGNFGYQVNGGSESVMGLAHQIEDGDYVDVAVYKSYWPDTESYSRFSSYTHTITRDDTIEISLEQAGYDENWNTVFSPCEGATVTIDDELTEYITDADGKAYITFDVPGTYILSATKDKTVNNATVPAITAPVCEVTVNDYDYNIITQNIVSKYCQSGVHNDANMVWLLMDMAVYSKLYPETESQLTEYQKQKALDIIIDDLDSTESASVLAKNIIALRAIGYDAKEIYNERSREFDAVSKLTALVDEKSDAVTNIYTLPYVIIALWQEGYATAEQMNYLVETAVLSKESWQNTEWGTDAASAMLLALAPYYNQNAEVENAVKETLPIILSAMDENCVINNAASTGIAIVALSAYDIDCYENGLINGLMTQANEDLDAFVPLENTFSTEQGLRGILAWQLYKEGTGKVMFDFSDNPTETPKATKKRSSSGGGGGGSYKPPVKEEVTPKPEEEVKEPETPKNIHPDVKVKEVIIKYKTFDDIKESKSRKKIEALAKRGIINGKTEKTFDPDATMTRAEFATIIARGLGLDKNIPAKFADIKADDWYYSYINTAYYYGIIKGVSETEFNPKGQITRQEADVMITRAASLCGMEAITDADSIRNILGVFTDYTTVDQWAKDAVAFCMSNGITNDDDIEIMPKKAVTRAEIAEMLYNMLEKSQLITEE